MSLYDTLLEEMSGKAYAGYFATLCPYHDDHEPSFFVYEDGWFRCSSASCQKRGRIETLAKYLGKSDYIPRQINHKVLPAFRKWLVQGDVSVIARQAHRSLMKSLPKYLVDRRLVDYVEPGLFGLKEGWITIPVRNQSGKIENMVCRGISSDKTRYVLFQQTECPVLYVPDWERVQNHDVVVVVYGIFDAWAMWHLGHAVVTGTTGTSLSADLLKPLGKEFIIVPDKREERKAFDLANALGWRGDVRLLDYPMGTKDPDEIRRKFGLDTLQTLLRLEN